MVKLDQGGARNWAQELKGAADETVRSPLWEFPPDARKAVIHERRRRFGVHDDEGYDIG
ncbi:hypothetical protein [Streptomyces sp. NPDC058872]|uniref:hypothetical protein n=1 Tax=Streptomyces sp. NPDC058872 TaxID=3346661 RepID=UPI0036CB1419